MSQTRGLEFRGHLLAITFTVVPCLLATTPANGASRQARERTARKACLNGDYTKGVAILTDLFVDTRDPTYIFNQGRCLEQNRRYEEAAARFEEYLGVADTKLTPENRAAAENRMAACRSKLPKEPVPPPIQPAPQPSALPTPAPAPEPMPQPAQPAAELVAQQAPEPVEGQRRWRLVTAGIITSVVGAGGVAAGIIFNLKANDAAKELETKVDAYPTKSDDEKKYKTLTWVGYGAGAACLVTGAVLIAVGAVKSSPKSSTEVAIVPQLGSGQVGALLTGAF